MGRALVVAAALAIPVMGCGNSIGEYCEKWADCEGGNEKDQTACEVELEGDAEVADVYECSSEWDDEMDCRAKYATCETDRLNIGDACGSENDKLDACVDAASANKP